MSVVAAENASIGSCELQLGDTWGGMQSKMSAVAPVKKIRKKPDCKPQSQINKCNNEKRRRELENETINQLEELLGACLSDVKQPDKNGIVQEAAQQIRLVLERRREGAGACCGACPPACRHRCPAATAAPGTPVQAGEVSSSQPRAHDDLAYYSEISTLIEALKHYTSNLGWVLLEINCDGEIECVTENVKDIIHWERSELYKQSIYNYLHHGDHQKLAPILQNVQTVSWPSVETDKFHSIRSRLLVKGDSQSEPAGYVEVVIHAAGVRGSRQAASVMCVVRRGDDATPGPLAADPGPPAFATKQPAQLVFKLDHAFNIITCDLTGVGSASGSPICRALEGVPLLDLVDPADRALVLNHLRDSPPVPAESVVSAPFRLRVGHEKTYITVIAESRLFRNPTSQEGDFVMSTHSLLSEEEVAALGASPATPPVGGPLMTSVANGTSSQEGRYPSHSPAEPNPFSISDFDLDFQQPSWDYGTSARSPQESYGAFPFDEMPSEDSKDKTEATRPAPAREPNRLRSLLSKKAESDDGASTSGATAANNRILKDLLKQEDEEGAGGESLSPRTPHTPHTPLTPVAASALSPQAAPTARAPVPSPAPPAPPPPPSTSHHTHNNSDMLLRILNEKSDDDNEESRREGRGAPQQSALLTQLLSNGPEGSKAGGAGARGTAGDYLDRFIPAKRKAEDPRPGPTVKRATPEAQQVSSTAAPPTVAPPATSTAPPTTSSSGMSTLCQKNQILVSLLVRQQSSPTTPLPSPNPNLRPFINGRAPRLPPAGSPAPPPPPRPPHPQHPTHPPHPHHASVNNMLSRSTSVNGGTTSTNSVDTLASSGSQSHLQMVLQGSRAYPGPAHPGPAHPGPVHPGPAPPYALNMQQQHFRPEAPNPSDLRTRGPVPGGGDGEQPNDKILSDLLDDFIELEPRPQPDLTLYNITQPRSEYAGMKEKDRINAITQSLMQVAETVESTSPVLSPGYSAQSPQGTMYGVNNRASGSGGAEGAGLAAGGGARARLLAEQQRARLLLEQRRQAMLVPQAAEQAPGDVSNPMEALLNSATPPNVALTRTDYHHNIYHPANQVGSTYGTNKITSQQQQQNPMLSAQLTGPYAQAQAQQGGSTLHGAHHASHHRPAPLSPAHPAHPAYHPRAARPHPMGGYYADTGAGGGYCVDYARRAAAPLQLDHALSCGSGGGGGGAGGASEYVRQEIRAVVGARARPELHLAHPPDLESLGLSYELGAPGGGSVVGGRARSASTGEWESHQSTASTTAAAGAAAAAGGDEAEAAGAARGAEGGAKSSLLQKLLSE